MEKYQSSDKIYACMPKTIEDMGKLIEVDDEFEQEIVKEITSAMYEDKQNDGTFAKDLLDYNKYSDFILKYIPETIKTTKTVGNKIANMMSICGKGRMYAFPIFVLLMNDELFSLVKKEAPYIISKQVKTDNGDVYNAFVIPIVDAIDHDNVTFVDMVEDGKRAYNPQYKTCPLNHEKIGGFKMFALVNQIWPCCEYYDLKDDAEFSRSILYAALIETGFLVTPGMASILKRAEPGTLAPFEGVDYFELAKKKYPYLFNENIDWTILNSKGKVISGPTGGTPDSNPKYEFKEDGNPIYHISTSNNKKFKHIPIYDIEWDKLREKKYPDNIFQKKDYNQQAGMLMDVLPTTIEIEATGSGELPDCLINIGPVNPYNGYFYTVTFKVDYFQEFWKCLDRNRPIWAKPIHVKDGENVQIYVTLLIPQIDIVDKSKTSYVYTEDIGELFTKRAFYHKDKINYPMFSIKWDGNKMPFGTYDDNDFMEDLCYGVQITKELKPLFDKMNSVKVTQFDNIDFWELENQGYDYRKENDWEFIEPGDPKHPDVHDDSVTQESFILESKLSSQDRNALDEDEFGIPEKRAFPLNDKSHIRAAVTFFRKAPKKFMHKLAVNILEKAKKFDMNTDNWKSIHKYAEEYDDEGNPVEKKSEEHDEHEDEAKSESYIEESAKSNDDMHKVENFKYSEVYFGSSKDFGNNEIHLGKDVLFVTPFKGLASIFITDRTLYRTNCPSFNGGKWDCNLGYDEWNLPIENIKYPFDTVHVRLEGMPEIEEYSFDCEGYIYTIEITDELKDSIYQKSWMNPDKEFLIVGHNQLPLARKEKISHKCIVKGAESKTPLTDDIKDKKLDYSLRPATKDDTENMYNWEMESVDETLKKEKWVQNAIREDVQLSIKDTQMIECSGKTIGMFTACYIDDPPVWYIGEIYIIPEYRGHGIGSRILKNQIEEHDVIRLQVAYSNEKAQKLYKSLGFKIVESRNDTKMYVMEYHRNNKDKSE